MRYYVAKRSGGSDPGGGGDLSAWNALLAAPGVVSSHRLDTQAELDTYYHSNRVPVLDPSVKPSGFAAMMRLDRVSSDGQGATNVRIPLGPYTEGDVFWLSYLVWISPEYWYQVSSATSGVNGARKIDTLASFDFSNEPWESVLQFTQASGVLRHYHQDGLSTAVHADEDFTSFYQAGDKRWQPEIDNAVNPFVSYPLTGTNPDTGAAWNAGEQERRRNGGTFGPRSQSLADYKVGIGDPLKGAFGRHSQIMRITRRVEVGTWDTNSSRITIWGALYGQPYFMLSDGVNIRLGGNGPFGGSWLNLFESTKVANSGRRVQSRTNNLPMIKIRSFGLSTPLGAGTLSWNASTQLATWAAFGHSAGVAAGFSAQKTTANLSSSGADSYMGVEVDGTLPTGGGITTDTITVEAGLDTASVRYGGWIESLQEVRSEGGHRALPITTLETAAAALAEGQRVQLIGMTGLTPGLIADDGPGGTVIEYGPRGFYDPSRKLIWYLGHSHANNDGSGKELICNLATNTWSSIASPDQGGYAHYYYQTALNRKNGTRYYCPYDLSTVRRKIAGGSWTSVATVQHREVCALEYHYGLASGAGGLVLFDDQGIYTSNAAVSSWTERLNINFGGAWLHPFAACLHSRGEVYGGGGDNGSSSILQWWRVNANATVTPMPTLPKSMGVSGKGIVVPHPNDTHLLCFGGTSGDKAVTRFDPVAQTWSPNLGNHQFGQNGNGDWVWMATMHELGVIFVMQTLGGGSPTAWLYKPHTV